MKELIMMKGLPASGKTTKAKKMIASGGRYCRVNRDSLREMLHEGKWTGKKEAITVDVAEVTVYNLLMKDHSVIVDDTNLGQKHEILWRAVAEDTGAEFRTIDMMDTTSWRECISRNRERDNSVPEGVIESMAVQYGYADLDKIIVCDIDGTVADCQHRRHHVEGEKKNWKEFFSEMDKDTPIDEVYKNAVNDAKAHDAKVIFVTARPEDYRDVTEQWLRGNGMGGHRLLMRRKGDTRPDTEVKFDIYERYLKQYDIIKVYDDRPSVIEMWREQGLEVEDVGNGKEF